MATIGESLGRRYGPLSGWQWGLVSVAGVGGLILLARYRQAKAAAASGGAPTLVPYRGTFPFDEFAADPVPGPGVLQPVHDGAGDASTGNGAAAPVISSNRQWLNLAVEQLPLQYPGIDPLSVEAAGQRFFAAQSGAREPETAGADWVTSRINKAISLLGAPPDTQGGL